ncbi:hypothetical protein GOBAR_AA32732 [Gossypium barbadense]|uniref:Pentacotripeptide-repeat region of PRORP domain-containing protein n=1 Tax=Gossypium barbadense TaxID=3634 RepID=A0A2P5WA45_GOSBA|nr:hypothetical protein GOBAR_AA32732 [Gossypium barbadense]
MRKQGIEPNVVTYSILVDAHCKEGMVSEAEDIIDAMIKRGIEPNVVTHNALINGHCLQNEMDKARRVFNLMIEMGCAPDIVTYSTMINGYCKAKRLDEAMELFHEISQKGPIPNTVTYNTLVQSMFQLGKVSTACELFRKMLASGQVPNIETTVLKGLCKTGNTGRAVRFLRLMESRGFEPNIVAYSTILDCLFKKGLLKEALDLFSEGKINICCNDNSIGLTFGCSELLTP